MTIFPTLVTISGLVLSISCILVLKLKFMDIIIDDL